MKWPSRRSVNVQNIVVTGDDVDEVARLKVYLSRTFDIN